MSWEIKFPIFSGFLPYFIFISKSVSHIYVQNFSISPFLCESVWCALLPDQQELQSLYIISSSVIYQIYSSIFSLPRICMITWMISDIKFFWNIFFYTRWILLLFQGPDIFSLQSKFLPVINNLIRNTTEFSAYLCLPSIKVIPRWICVWLFFFSFFPLTFSVLWKG